jgi:hypothetical protein
MNCSSCSSPSLKDELEEVRENGQSHFYCGAPSCIQQHRDHQKKVAEGVEIGKLCGLEEGGIPCGRRSIVSPQKKGHGRCLQHERQRARAVA